MIKMSAEKFWTTWPTNGSLAQRLEQATHNGLVVGSIPTASTSGEYYASSKS